MNKTDIQNADYFRSRYEEMKSQAASWQSAWKELTKYIAPTRGFFEGDNPSDGRKLDHRALIDSDPLLAVEVLSAGMMSGLTSPSRSWFELSLPDGELMKQSAVRAWTHEVRRRMEEVFARSNIYSVLHGFYQEISVFGTAAFLLEEDFDRVISCRLFTAGEYVLEGPYQRFRAGVLDDAGANGRKIRSGKPAASRAPRGAGKPRRLV